MRHAFVLLCLLGCGGATEPERQRTAGDEVVVRVDEVAVDETRVPGACPRSFGERGPTCSADDYPVGCTYPEGVCGCSQPVYCGGAAPPPMPASWTCSAPPVPCAPAGSPCSGDATCSTDGCGWSGVACQNGVWTTFMLPPPP